MMGAFMVQGTIPESGQGSTVIMAVLESLGGEPSLCSVCGSPLEVGNNVVLWGSEWCHRDCWRALLAVDDDGR